MVKSLLKAPPPLSQFLILGTVCSLLQKSACIQCLIVQYDTNCLPRRNVYVKLNSIVCLTFYPACIAETKNERALYTWQILRHVLQERKLLSLPVYVPSQQASFENGFAFLGSKFFPFRVDPFSEGVEGGGRGGQNNLDRVVSLKK